MKRKLAVEEEKVHGGVLHSGSQIDMATIFHITKHDEWERAKREGMYQAPSLASEGFIHCSTSDQVIRTANRLFHRQMGLVLLEIEPRLVTAKIRYENCEGGQEAFPHIYGALDPGSVVRVLAFEPGKDGSFALPSS